ncbi:uncharacterized protein LAESUDRAFT_764058 [Laetiporus sulphureus 93-53]|uniref:Uncharacterized protein n=1 Tax=Laetiporus sulphureus 93-53 TaxID=1314785 RepID=A0A165BGN4_9APHY|nr:uncharacterized protein LAESUDRAFT_764058 [Laetiporus sulphureus 93-53]KZT01020.1 hypothetical protein LAESUDRAFT_764058 [Laetiporus sulphureus 93-53]
MPQLHDDRPPPKKARARIYSDEEEDIRRDRTRPQTSTRLVEHLFDDDVPCRPRSHSTGQDNQQDEDDQQEDEEQEDDGIEPRHFEKLIREMHYSKADKSKLDVWSDAARFIPRAMGPFIDILQTLQVGIACHGVAKDAWDLTDWPYLAYKVFSDDESASKLIEHYSTLLRIIPGLAKLVPHFENEPEDLVHFATFLSRKARSARTDDLSNVKKNILRFVPTIRNVPYIDSEHPKEARGFHHFATARLLCPRRIREHFDEDPEKFCKDVLEGQIPIASTDLPSMVYPENGYNPCAVDENALKSDLLASCFRALFTRPRSGKLPRNKVPGEHKKGGGHNPIAYNYRMKECNEYNIAYLARFAANSQSEWTEADDDFCSEEFFNFILALFEDPEWREKTLAWYNAEVFGKGPRASSEDSAQLYVGPSSLDLLTQQRAARRAMTQVATPPLSSEDGRSEIEEPVDASTSLRA